MLFDDVCDNHTHTHTYTYTNTHTHTQVMTLYEIRDGDVSAGTDFQGIDQDLLMKVCMCGVAGGG